ncbi:CBU_0592 family membrane protein [Isoptericola jiangsuensis]|uniref:CBU_0592 family membrane protein n=1 Tax=Isoptericola jiangsuensis TaxID=548579 RepID=UPI003AADABB1
MSFSILTLITALGWVGAVAGLVAYAMVSRGRWSSSSWAFQITNIAGAIIMTVVAGVNGVWPSAAANVAWIVIGIQTLMMASKNRQAAQAAVVAPATVVPEAVAEVELPLVDSPLDLAAAERAVELTPTLEFHLPDRELVAAGTREAAYAS